jgi:hypothetical protein
MVRLVFSLLVLIYGRSRRGMVVIDGVPTSMDTELQ